MDYLKHSMLASLVALSVLGTPSSHSSASGRRVVPSSADLAPRRTNRPVVKNTGSLLAKARGARSRL